MEDFYFKKDGKMLHDVLVYERNPQAVRLIGDLGMKRFYWSRQYGLLMYQNENGETWDLQ